MGVWVGIFCRIDWDFLATCKSIIIALVPPRPAASLFPSPSLAGSLPFPPVQSSPVKPARRSNSLFAIASIRRSKYLEPFLLLAFVNQVLFFLLQESQGIAAHGVYSRHTPFSIIFNNL